MTKIKFFTVTEVIIFHNAIVEKFGGLAGLRDRGLLESAVHQPKATFDDKYLHQDLYHMAAAYCYHIIKNHAFIDGNKRTGIYTATTFLLYNDVICTLNEQHLYNMAISIAMSTLNKDQVATLFRTHAQ